MHVLDRASSRHGPRLLRQALSAYEHLAAWPITLTALLYAAALLALVALSVTAMLQERRVLLHQTQADLANAVQIAAEHVERSLDGVDLYLGQLIDDAAQSLSLPALADRVFRSFAARADRLPQIEDLAVVDAGGRIQFSTVPKRVGLDVSDRPYFVLQRSGATRGLYINAPVLSRITPGRRLLPISWPIRDQAGRFLGIVVATTTADYFARFLNEAAAGVGGLMVLVDDSGTVHVANQRYASGGSAILPAFDRDGARPLAPVRQTVNGTAYWLAGRPLDHHPLRLLGAFAEAEALHAWRTRTLLIGSTLAGIVLLLGGLGAIAVRLALRERTSVHDAQEARRHAEVADQAKSDFLATMSHEIRTPLTTVLAVVDLLSVENLSDRQAQLVKAIRSSGEQLLSIINNILDFMRLGGRVELATVDFALAGLLEDVRSILGPQAQDRGLSLAFEVAPDVPPVLRGDPALLKQLLLNLASNGLKFTVAGGVTVRVSELSDGPQARLRFEVQDTGVGMTEEQQAHVFEPFVQADRSTDRAYGGSGLGLAICRRLVDAMGGRIGVDSTPGQGSTFWMELTLMRGNPNLAANRSSEAVPTAPPMRVLLVEDVQLNQDLIREMLTRLGHDVMVAGNGLEALELCISERFDVVLMDIQMPVMDGVKAVRLLRRQPGPNQHTPVIALTANVFADEHQRYLAAGMNGRLTKPVTWAALSKLLASLAEGELDETESVAASAAEAALLADPGSAPLIDRKMLASFSRNLSADEAAQFIGEAVEEAERVITMLEEADDPEAARLLHRLKGTARSFGLARVGAFAAAMEHRAKSGAPWREMLPDLDNTLEETEAAIAQGLD